MKKQKITPTMIVTISGNGQMVQSTLKNETLEQAKDFARGISKLMKQPEQVNIINERLETLFFKKLHPRKS